MRNCYGDCAYENVSGYITTDRAKQKVHIFADTKN